MTKRNISDSIKFPVVIRRLLLSWLAAATISYMALPRPLQNLQSMNGISQMSIAGTVVMLIIFFAAFTVIGHFQKDHTYERWLILIIYGLYSITALSANFSWSFLVTCLLLFAVLSIYALKGWQNSRIQIHAPKSAPGAYKILLCIAAATFVVFVSVWTVCRIYSFCTPTYDFGIFSQMFYNMKTVGVPYTTVERDMLLSHFSVHVSPIYYLLLPIYFIFPFPATLQILQAIILASSVIPLWLLCRRHGLTPGISLVFCVILLVYPAFSAGTSYDIHENAFLSPLILWLIYGLDTKSTPITILSACLTLMVKEDAAVYVAVIALYLITRSILKKNDPQHLWELFFGISLLVGSVIWFLIVTRFLSTSGDGVMTYRYQNFMTSSDGSLFHVIQTIILCPGKVLLECSDPEKLKFIFLTLVPLLGLPFFTRRYERYILLIPYILVNLMSDYQYQHDIFFQYTLGSTVCLIYLAVVNLSDFRLNGNKLLIGVTGFVLCCLLFVQNVVPVASRYPRLIKNYGEQYRNIRQTLEQIPIDASVAATTFYTTQLSQREILYDVKYTSEENLLSADYVALAIHSDTNYKRYETEDNSGFDNLVMLLESNGYTIFAQLENTLVIYRK